MCLFNLTIPLFFGHVGALGDEVLTPSSATRRMAEGSKTDLAFLQLVRDRMAKAAGASSQRAATGSEGSGKSAATSSGLPPRPKRAKKVKGPGWTSQLAVDLGGVLGSHFSHASRAFPALKQVLELSDSEKGSEVVGLSPSQAIDMASHFFFQVSDSQFSTLFWDLYYKLRTSFSLPPLFFLLPGILPHVSIW